ncbi:MAG TPA: SRPBCC domain-containing protein [Kofleriaceae bacterium]|nr:SRPBCC domain-containing protein [Kofleriaceae bacterium]
MVLAAISFVLEVRAATEIAAAAPAVWAVLTDLRSFAAWNPFIREARGSTEVGGTVHVRVRSALGVPLAFHAKVIASDAEHELHWCGHVLAPWLARGEHWFTIEPLGDRRVRFEQRERFSGLLPWLARRLLAREARCGFAAMNEALAARAEEAQW